MNNNRFGVRAAGAALASIALLPTFAFAQYYSYPTSQMYGTQSYTGSYYTPSYSSYSYGSAYPSYDYGYSSYGTPSIYISTGGDVYGGDYIPTINGSDPANSGYSYGYIPTMGTYTGGYGYPQNYNYGYNTQPYVYGYNPNQNGYNYNPGYGYTGSPAYYNTPTNYGTGSGYYNACNSAIGGVCGQDLSIGLGAAIYHTLLPYNYTTGL